MNNEIDSKKGRDAVDCVYSKENQDYRPKHTLRSHGQRLAHLVIGHKHNKIGAKQADVEMDTFTTVLLRRDFKHEVHMTI